MEILRRMTDAPIVYCNHSQPFWEIVRSLAGYDRTHRHLTPLYLLSRAYKQWKTRRRVMRAATGACIAASTAMCFCARAT